jgi:hypothetical protein
MKSFGGWKTGCATVFYGYVSRRPRYSFWERSGLSGAQISALTRDLTVRQAESALWYDKLPVLLRVIPAAPI